jgi:hypothetical protein
MMGGLPSTAGAFGALITALLVFGLLPGLVLSLIVRLLYPDDARRRELQAELYAVPRWERPFWVCEQLELALRQGVFPHITWKRPAVEPAARGVFHQISPGTGVVVCGADELPPIVLAESPEPKGWVIVDDGIDVETVNGDWLEIYVYERALSGATEKIRMWRGQ